MLFREGESKGESHILYLLTPQLKKIKKIKERGI